jgi:beta-lactamase class A
MEHRKGLWKYLLVGTLALLLTNNLNNYFPKTEEKQKTEETISKKKVPISNLEKKIINILEEKKEKNQLLKDEITAWSVYDFSTGEKLVSINEDLPLQAASMIKPFFALAYYELEKKGKVKYSKEIKEKMERMIRNSDNKATNEIIKKIGRPKKIEKILKKSYPGIFKQTSITEYIPREGKTYKNKASAHDYSRFLYALWNNKFPRSEELKRLMNLKGKDRIFYNVSNIPNGTNVYNKTGTTGHLVGDMGILSPKTKKEERKQYTMIGIIQKNNKITDEKELKKWYWTRGNLIREISGITYEEMKKRNNLK